ncbi:hypothetical protein SAMN04489712_112167 [Thermomonospora echinospora]|uniref:Uncharacterized protein n=1 Tax=Thermomonospora echinospora TaxID=1992 RepID=A0A1H6D2U2_9ACTN|nr:hypothetical protein [Thermomonospora echinospora]SEG79095.1 hypothetical protein SAMN04489712_112167 [Thermomonospora echinospora]
MTEERRPEQSTSLADRRAEAGAPVDSGAEPDIAEEWEPGPTDPPNAEADTPGGEAEGYTPHTRAP